MISKRDWQAMTHADYEALKKTPEGRQEVEHAFTLRAAGCFYSLAFWALLVFVLYFGYLAALHGIERTREVINPVSCEPVPCQPETPGEVQ